MEQYQTLLIEDDKRIRTITINRAEKLNALNKQTLLELSDALIQAENESSIDVLIITGSGEKAFIAGADIQELHALDAQSGLEFALYGQRVFNRIEKNRKPVIAAVNGFALGGGCELALACCMRVASENAKFGQPEVNLGIIPGYGGTQRLPRLVGKGKAVEMILTGNMIDAQQALSLGLVNEVVPVGKSCEKAKEFAEKILTKGQVAVQSALKSINLVTEMGLEEGLKQEAALFALTCGSLDFKEGTKAFLEKRQPSFQNR